MGVYWVQLIFHIAGIIRLPHVQPLRRTARYSYLISFHCIVHVMPVLQRIGHLSSSYSFFPFPESWYCIDFDHSVTVCLTPSPSSMQLSAAATHTRSF